MHRASKTICSESVSVGKSFLPGYGRNTPGANAKGVKGGANHFCPVMARARSAPKEDILAGTQVLF